MKDRNTNIAPLVWLATARLGVRSKAPFALPAHWCAKDKGSSLIFKPSWTSK